MAVVDLPPLAPLASLDTQVTAAATTLPVNAAPSLGDNNLLLH